MSEVVEKMEMLYAESHEWIAVEGGVATIGVSDYAQKELGDIVFVELPDTGEKVAAGDEAAVLESTKAAADVYSPVSGEIIAVNDALEEASGLVNDHPESKGWLFKVRLSAPEELEALMNGEKYKEFVG